MKELVTKNLAEAIGPQKLRRVVTAFRYLYLADPKERHFSIKFCNFDEGRGREIWIIVDEYPENEGGLTATFLLPSDY